MGQGNESSAPGFLLPMNNQEIRQQFRSKRSQLSSLEQNICSAQLALQVIQSKIFQSSKNIAFYLATNGEADPTLILQTAWQQHKNCYLPIVTQEKKLLFAPYFFNDELIPNRYNILEPKNQNNLITPDQLDLVLVPLVAFDKHGHRLGMGAGYYDRTFAFLNTTPPPPKPFLLGLAYEWQKVEKLSRESWDVKLNGVATERGVTLCATG
jgi:5-formyltetrahydrofolate cyclo-ligase